MFNKIWNIGALVCNVGIILVIRNTIITRIILNRNSKNKGISINSVICSIYRNGFFVIQINIAGKNGFFPYNNFIFCNCFCRVRGISKAGATLVFCRNFKTYISVYIFCACIKMACIIIFICKLWLRNCYFRSLNIVYYFAFYCWRRNSFERSDKSKDLSAAYISKIAEFFAKAVFIF